MDYSLTNTTNLQAYVIWAVFAHSNTNCEAHMKHVILDELRKKIADKKDAEKRDAIQSAIPLTLKNMAISQRTQPFRKEADVAKG